MIEKKLPNLNGSVVFFVGIKGTGMTALAELFRSRGAIVTGSDVEDVFYTDKILEELGIPVFPGFSAENLPESTRLLIHSAAYSPETPEIAEAERLGIEILTYPEALGSLSRESLAAAVAGVHGKTTTTAIAGTLLKQFDLPGTVLTGSAASNFGGRCTFVNGNKYFIAETCEYKRNFLNYSADYLIITSVEPDHLDYYKDFDDILSAFTEFGTSLSDGGRLIYCADDEGAAQAAGRISGLRPDISLIPYGFSAEGQFCITDYNRKPGSQLFTIKAFGEKEFSIHIPGRHNVLNSTAAAALVCSFLDDEDYSGDRAGVIAEGLAAFRGTKRRSEIIGERDEIMIMDDYGHHPMEIRTTIEGLRDFYPGRRIIVDFMSHTYSRTEALVDDFSRAFKSADMVILHKIYASAREKAGTIRGRDLFDLTLKKHGNVHYFEEVMDAYEFVEKELKPGDLFLTMGAGDNWKLGHRLFEKMTEGEQGCTE
jgi:UDP-N-acetylmuramate--alanine ligase